MVFQTLSVQNFRTFELYSIELDSRVTVIIGQNGTGKTSLLEAVYFSLRGTSFRGRDRDMLKYNQQKLAVKVEGADGSVRRTNLQLITDDKIVKNFEVGGKTTGRLTAKYRAPVVLFEPDELRLLTSSPQRRRDFVDGIIARLSPTYSTVLSRFSRTLLQRNELLKQYEVMQHAAWESHLFAWDVKLAELSATIIKARTNFITHSNEHLSRLYSDLANSTHQVTAFYQTAFHQTGDALQQAVLHKLEATRQSDALRGFTSAGPHRDDVELLLDGHAASESASRGEMRTIMLAFKLLEVELQTKHADEKPLILLDDVFSELDVSREQALINALKEYQTIITATDLRDELKANASIIILK